MGKVQVFEIKAETAQAQKNLDEINETLEVQAEILLDLENDLNKYESQLAKTNKTDLAGRKKLNDKIQKTKQLIKEEKLGIKNNTAERKKAVKALDEQKKSSSDLSGVMGLADKATGGMVSSLQGVVQGAGKATMGFRTLRGAIMATGIGALVIAIGSLIAAFTSSEEGQKKFKRFFTQIKVVIGNVTDILADFGMAIIKVFSGDFAGAKESIDAVTEGIKNFGEETAKEIEKAGELADKRAKAEKVERKLIVERAEAQRKINEIRERAADKENVTVQDRIKMLREAGQIADDITKKEIENARLLFEAKQTENSLSKSTTEDLNEEAELKARLINLESQRLRKQKALTAEITSALREEESERKAIEAERRARQKELDAQKKKEHQAELSRIKKEENARIQAEKDRIARELKQSEDRIAREDAQEKLMFDLTVKGREREEMLALQEFDKMNAIADGNAELELEVRNNLNAKLDAIDAKYAKQAKDKKDAVAEEDKQREFNTQMSKMALASSAISSISTLLDAFGKKDEKRAKKAFQVNKALTMVQIGINTAMGIMAELSDPKKVLTFTNYAAAVAMGIAGATQLAVVASKKFEPTGSGGGGGGISKPAPPASIGTGASQPPSFNVVGQSGTNQIAEAINDQPPVQAYVVAGDVTTAQQLENNTIEQATF